MNLDISGNPCQYDTITAPVPQFGIEMPCASRCETGSEIKFTHGGYRPGAGRKPKSKAAFAVETPRWYCVRTEYRAETQVDVAIRDAGFETLYPKMWVPPVAARLTESGRAIPATSERLIALLASYTFVKFNIANPSWRHIATMRGVVCILSSSPERPIPIPDAEIACLRATLAPNDCKYPDADPEPAARVKKRWVQMLDGLGARQMEAA